MLTSKIVTEILENHSEFSGCSKICNCFKLILKLWNYLWYCYMKSSGVGGGGARGASTLPKALICWKSGLASSLKIWVKTAPNVAWLH